jgi:AcrR family transcriptional regulator
MATPASDRLPRGRHGLSREEVVSSQRARILLAMAEVMAEKGYVATSVSHVVSRAGVSRETFYQQFDSKQDCFLHALQSADGMLEALLENQVDHPGTVAERLDAAVGLYLEALAFSPAMARLVLVESYAAGPEAMARRSETQRRIAHGLADLVDIAEDDELGRFGCELLVAGMGSLVTTPLVQGDLDVLRAMRQPLVALAVRHLEGG